MRTRWLAFVLAAGTVAAFATAAVAQGPGGMWMHGTGGHHMMGSGGAVNSPPPAEGTAEPEAGDAQRGRRVYLSRCAACHNPDPSRDGPVGPAVKGSSRDLVMARVLFAAYPRGYAPKRRTWIMPAQPDLGPAVADLVAYLKDH